MRDSESAERYRALSPYQYVWGDTLPLFHSAELRLANLETSLTTHPEKWPRQAFNFRAHPDNVRALQEARLGSCLRQRFFFGLNFQSVLVIVALIESPQTELSGLKVGANTQRACA